MTRTLIFGAGTDCARLLADGLPGEEIVGLLDNNASKHGTTVHGHCVLNPARIPQLQFDRIRIASTETNEILQQLVAMGVPESRITAPMLEPENRRQLAALRYAHAGLPAVIVGNGPSLRIGDLDRLVASDAVAFAFNKIYLAYDRTPFRPDYYIVEDFLVAENNAAEIDALTDHRKLFPETLIRWVKKDANTTLFGLTHRDLDKAPPLFSQDPLDFKWGSTVVHTAIQWACYMGCDPIYLIGVDFNFSVPTDTQGQVLHSVGEVNHFVPNYRKPGERWNRPMLELTRHAYEAAHAHAVRNGRRILNATRGGALEVFPRVNFDQVFPSDRGGGRTEFALERIGEGKPQD